jgi:hypothetical protein
MIVRPSFVVSEVGVRDISPKGIGLLCAQPIMPGTRLAIFWDYCPPETWRTLTATVVHLSPSGLGGWIVGCTFASTLATNEVQAMVLGNRAAWSVSDED